MLPESFFKRQLFITKKCALRNCESVESIIKKQNYLKQFDKNNVQQIYFGPSVLPLSGPFRRFSTSIWQNARLNTISRAMVCDMYFSFFKIFLTTLKGLLAFACIYKKVKIIVFILNLLTCSNIYNF